MSKSEVTLTMAKKKVESDLNALEPSWKVSFSESEDPESGYCYQVLVVKVGQGDRESVSKSLAKFVARHSKAFAEAGRILTFKLLLQAA